MKITEQNGIKIKYIIMNEKNKTNFSKVLPSIYSIIETFGVDILAGDIIWSMVLGTLPHKEGELENNVLEMSLKDSTEDKVDNIQQITDLAKLITTRPDYSISNLTDFTYAIKQLISYTSGDDIASGSLSDLKDIYISYITSYYYESMTLGEKREALETLKYFGEEILKDNEEMSTKLVSILSYQPLN